MKKVILIISTLAIIATGAYTWHFYSSEHQTTTALSLVPNKMIYLLETEKPIDNWQTFSQSEFWSFMKQHKSFAELTKDADYLDSLVDANKNLFDILGKRKFYMSAHLTSSSSYDFLFLVDLKKASKLNALTNVIKNLVDQKDFIIKEEEYKGYSVIELYNKNDQSHLYLCQVQNFLVCTYAEDLILNSIDKHQNEKSDEQLLFNMISQVSTSGLARIYLNFEFLDDYINLYSSIDLSILQSLSESFGYAGLDMDIDDKNLVLSGYSSLPDSVITYTHLLQKYGNSEFEFAEIISARTAYLQAVGINDFKDFYKEVIALRSKGNQREYNAVKQQVERVLGLSLEKDILPWIGNEIVISQNKPSQGHRPEDELLITLKTYNLDFAKEKLQLIQKRIKKRTPAKFKKLKYKTYDIYYLDIKGFFSVFFGKAFDKITKPYYCVVDDYVVFSNSPTTLVSMLDDYENALVLANDEMYNKVSDELPEESTLFAYVNGNLSYPTLRTDVKDINAYNRNKPYFTFFKGIGFTYTSSDHGFENKGYISYDATGTVTPLPINLSEENAKEYLEDYKPLLNDLTESETFVLNEVYGGKFVKYFKGTNTIHLESETKKGVFHGKFKEYYANGNLRSEGKYRKGRKVGRWKYYQEDGQLSEKEWEGL